ncbi:HAMP domain-containing sensor histidine kinase [uncultured Subdoligranulum sp.]|uniref:sensor histidine kinase n=1 Tax=uncultured Subdoligranulum sp. TaxID=512298 RepID=UPI0026080126|nr:HAMP domain-containing sensor histidine kinase [uncultured Subdoligranulum sp.]
MNRRNTISSEFFSTIAVVLVLGLSVMCAIQTALSAAYFVRERRTALTAILDGASALSERFAEWGNIVTRPIDDEMAREGVRDGFELFDTASGALVFVASEDGEVQLHTGAVDLNGGRIPQDLLDQMNSGEDVFDTGTMDGLYPGRYYTAGRRIMVGGAVGYLFAASPMTALGTYIGDMLVMFGISAAAILLLCSLLCWVLAKRITGPIEDISEAARRLGSGDFTARAPVDGCVELAEFATTFNNMAMRLQTIDNSRGQFMGNIAHELRTPMTTIKGFIDGMLDGTIPQEENQHYLTIVSQETGRLARLVQNMLDITKLEAGEVPVHARTYDLWKTITDVVLSDEQRIEDGKIDIEGLDGPPMLIYADPDFVHQVVYNIVDNAIKFTPEGGSIRFSAQKKGDMVEVRIENTGAGIAPEALPFVFERFYKEDRSRGVNTRGSGLGLHICKILINLSGGKIHAESEPGKWCRFVFTLPAGK